MSPDEAAAVLRRAAEIQAARDLGPDDALDAAAVVQLGGELGLAEEAVQAALLERRRASTTSSLTSRTVLGLDAQVVVERYVPLRGDAVQGALGEWLRRECLERQRTEPGRTTWRARRGPAADLRRGLDVLRTLRLKGVGAVELRTEDEGDGTRVGVTLALTAARSEAVGLLVALPAGVVGGAAVVAGVVAGPEALLGLPLAAAAGGAGWLGARATLAARRRQVVEAVDSVLDELTHG